MSEVLFSNLALRMTITFKLGILIKHVSRVDPKPGSSVSLSLPAPNSLVIL